MNPERWHQIEQLYHTALEREAGERDDFLAAACAGDEALRREVESLLQFHDRADNFIEAPALEVVAQLHTDGQDHLLNGQRLGPYQVIALIGAGGMGEVYRALDTRLEREVAIKVLPPFLAEAPQALAQFKREAKAVAALSHPNILAIHDFGTEQGASFVVMELLQGETLRARLGRSALPWRKAAKIGVAIADGLAAAHAKGIIHRDLKPENIFLTVDGQVKILDFGIAHMKSAVVDAETEASDADRPAPIMGTVNYMSPEQLRGEAVEATSDIFSFGCVLYEMVTGSRPFARSSTAETVAAIMADDPPLLNGRGKDVPSQLEQVVKHCLEKEAGERFQSARDLAFALRAVLGGSRGLGVLASPPAARFRGALWVALVLAVLVAAFVVWRNLPRTSAITSLAILPLVNESADPNMDYLADGIPESVNYSLSQLPNLKVISYSSVIAYRGQEVNPQTVGHQLGVGAVLLGRIAQRGDEISISAEMVDASDSHLLWGKQYHRRLADLYVVQEEIAWDICEQLRLKLTNEERRQLTKRYTENAEAYQLYLKGRYYWNKREPTSIRKAIDYFEQAISKDPEYALAYAGLADSYAVPSSGLPAKERMPKAEEMARQALALDDTLAEAHASLGYVKYRFDWDWQGAEEEFKRAIALNQSYATAYEWYGTYLGLLDRFDEAMARLKQAQEFDPNSPIILVDTAITLYGARQYDQAIEQCQQALELDAYFRLAHQYLGRVYEQKKQYEDAVREYLQYRALGGNAQDVIKELKEAFSHAGWKGYLQKALSLELARSKTASGSALTIAELYARLGENDLACKWLDQAFQEHDDRLVFLNADPRFEGLKSDSRFVSLLHRIGLPPPSA